MMKTFSFDFDLVKAEASDDGKLMVSGVASDTTLDKQKDRMTVEALKSMESSAIGVPIVTDHRAELHDVIGEVTEAKAEANGTFVIKAELDSDDPRAVALYKKISKGHKAGFSVGGSITAAKPSLAKNERHIISGVALDHIALTRKPANSNTFAMAIAKSLTEIDGETAMDETTVTKSEGDKVEVNVVDAPDHNVNVEAPKTAPSVQPEVKPEANPSEDAPQVAKAGAKFSSATLGVINEALSSNSIDDIKGKLKGLIDAGDLYGEADEPKEAEGSGKFIGLGKTDEVAKAEAPVLSEETVKDLIAKSIADYLAKTATKPEGKSAPALTNNFALDLSKVDNKTLNNDLIAKAINVK